MNEQGEEWLALEALAEQRRQAAWERREAQRDEWRAAARGYARDAVHEDLSTEVRQAAALASIAHSLLLLTEAER